MAYVRKTKDVFVVRVKYTETDGWEDVTAEETRLEARKRAKEYRENEPGYPVRISKSRERIKPDHKQ